MTLDYINYLIAGIWAVLFLVGIVTYQRDKRAPADDIGVMFLFVLCIYGTVPVLSWLMQGGWYDAKYDPRLSSLQPTIEENISLLEIYLMIAVGFASVYLMRCGRLPRSNIAKSIRIEDPLYSAALCVMFFGLAVNVILTTMTMARADSYMDQYRVINELPTFLRQLLKIIGGITGFAKIVVLVGILQRLPKSWLLLVVYVVDLLVSYDPEGARNGLVLGLLVLLIGWHRLVRPIRVSFWILIATVGLGLFQLAGQIREAGSLGEAKQLSGPWLHLGEADELWANALDITRFKSIGGSIPLNVSFEEIYSFIPSQLLPFEKLSLAQWFVNEFYPAYAEAGGAWAFGMAAQCVAGYGLLEALLRGALLALIASWFTKKYRQQGAWWIIPLYLYFFSVIYHTIRASSLVLLADFVQFVIPTIIVLNLFRSNPSRQHSPLPAFRPRPVR